MSKFFIIILLLFIKLSFSNNTIKIDSLIEAVNTVKTDTGKVNLLLNISRYYWLKDNKLSLRYAKKALEISVEKDYKEGIAGALSNIGIASMYDNNNDKAIENILKAEAIYEELKDTSKLKGVLINIGSIFYSMEEYEKSKKYLNKALSIYQSLNNLSYEDSVAFSVIYNNLSLCYLAQNITDKAIALQLKNLGLTKKLRRKKSEAIAYANLGLMYEKIDSLNTAEYYFKKAIKQQKAIKNEYGIVLSVIDLANFYSENNKIDTALILINEAIQIAEQKQYLTQLPRAYLTLVDIYKKNKDYEKALSAYENYVKYKDYNANKSSYEDIDKIKQEYKEAVANKEKQKQEFELKRQKIIRNAFIAIALVVIILIIVLFNRYKIKTKSERELQKLNTEKNKLFSILAHDLKGPVMGISTLSEAIVKNFDVLSKKELLVYNKKLHETSKSIYYLLENILDWATSQINVRKYTFENLNLKKIADAGVFSLLLSADKKDISVNVNIPDDIFVYADSNTLKTIFRNLTNNAIKFTNKGGKVNISAQKINDNKVKIEFKDTGIGISKKNLEHLFDIGKQQNSTGTANEKGTGFGLLIVKEFAEKNKAKIFVESTVGKGTTFTMILKEGKNEQN